MSSVENSFHVSAHQKATRTLDLSCQPSIKSIIWFVSPQNRSIITPVIASRNGDLQEKMPLFYDRLHEALHILSEYFLCDGHGLDPDRLYNDCYRELDIIFGLAKMSTEQLIAEYHRERLNDQYSITVPEFGVLEVRVYFRNESLCVEVFSARDVIPLDPNGTFEAVF